MTCWIPERVWSEKLISVISDRSLANGGYGSVVLDDRALFRVGRSYEGSPRQVFDRLGPYGEKCKPRIPIRTGLRHALRETATAYRLATTELIVLPVSAHLRYWIPPRESWHLSALDQLLSASHNSANPLLVYADDLEKPAGVGGWRNDPRDYEALLVWLRERADMVTTVRLPEWLGHSRNLKEREVEGATFYELARTWGAGEEYRGWAGSHSWEPYARIYAAASDSVEDLSGVASDDHLTALARKHLLASAHETAWHDPDENEKSRVPAPWARSVASHARACLPLCHAAREMARSSPKVTADITDIDRDGSDETLMRNHSALAMLAPAFGGRLVYLFIALRPEVSCRSAIRPTTGTSRRR